MRDARTSAEHETKVPHLFEKDGVYHLRVCLPWDNAALVVALHGVSTYADALRSISLFNFTPPANGPAVATESR
jgi:hypothetical protein